MLDGNLIRWQFICFPVCKPPAHEAAEMAGEVAEAQKVVLELCFRHPEVVTPTVV